MIEPDRQARRRLAEGLIISLLLMPATLVRASDTNPLYGLWGTEKQCNRALIIASGTKKAAPFNIGSEWLEHGDLWCRLNWATVNTTSYDVFAVAYALCGEDDVRNYKITYNLRDNALAIQWNQHINNGPLRRCDVLIRDNAD